jgi:hypothetical protein
MEDLKHCAMNHPHMSPFRFIERAAIVYGYSTSVIYNSTNFTWSHTYERCCRITSALSTCNISQGDVISIEIFHIRMILFIGILLFFHETQQRRIV